MPKDQTDKSATSGLSVEANEPEASGGPWRRTITDVINAFDASEELPERSARPAPEDSGVDAYLSRAGFDEAEGGRDSERSLSTTDVAHLFDEFDGDDAADRAGDSSGRG